MIMKMKCGLNAFVAAMSVIVLCGCNGGGEKTASAPDKNSNAVPEKLSVPGVKREVQADGVTVEKFTVHSDIMDRDIKAGVVLPPGYEKSKSAYPVLYALHGANAPYDSWSKMAPLNSGLKEKPMVIVFFDGDPTGYYVDSVTKPKSQFTSFFFKELMPYIEKHYRVNNSRHLCGFSMGGYGSMHYMLCHPEYFKSVFVYSSGLHYMDNVNGLKPGKRGITHFGNYDGNEKNYAPYSVYLRLDEFVKQGKKLPPVKMVWGSEDKVAETDEMSRYFVDYWKKRGYNVEWERLPGGHTWKFWRDNSPKILDFVWKNR